MSSATIGSEPSMGDDTEPGPSGRSAGRGDMVRRLWPAVLCVVVYVALGLLAYGVRSPVSSTTLPPCGCDDIASQTWLLAWPAHALSTGQNPFFSNAVAYPGGINLMTNTGAPLLGILSAPVNWALGPISAYNLVMRLGFVLSAISMCFVLRRWTRWWPAAFAGGLLYAYCPFMVGQGLAHDFLTFVPLPPIILALLDEIVIRRRHPVRNGVLLGVVVTAQLLISPEILVMAGLLAVVGLAVLALRHPVGALERAGDVGRALGGAVVALIVLGGYPLWMYFKGPYHVSGPPHPIVDLASYFGDPQLLVFPTTLERFSIGIGFARGLAISDHGSGEYATYIGIPMLVLLAVVVIRFRRDGRILIMSLVALAAWSVTLGDHIRKNSLFDPSIKLPYHYLRHVPLVDGAFDLRYSVMMYLGIAAVLAVGLDRFSSEGLLPATGRRAIRHAGRPHRNAHAGGPQRSAFRRSACLLAAVVALLPLVPELPYTSTPTTIPSLFTAKDSPIRDGDVVLSYPLPVGYRGPMDEALLWQAAARMRFKLIGFRGAVAGRNHKPITGAELLLPPLEAEQLLVWGLYGKPTPPPATAATFAAIRTFLARYHVNDVSFVPVAGRDETQVLSELIAALEVQPTRFDGSYVWSDVPAILARDRTRPTG